MTRNQKFYVVWKGRHTGIFKTWEEASAQVSGFPGAQYKAFSTRAEAENALRAGHQAREIRAGAKTSSADRWKQLRLLGVEPPILPSYCADAASSSNPGVMEYRAADTETGKILFERGPFPEGTNNIGEFLGLVETLMLLRKRKETSPIYSDSRTALAWVAAKQCKTHLIPNERNAELFDRIAQAERWLHRHTYSNPVLKWRTADWGEIPADYGRK